MYTKLHVFCIAMLLSSLTAMAQEKTFDRQAHRGGTALMPENTIPAMKNALDIGVETLELDVVISKDKQAVVSHDVYFSSAITLTPEGDSIPKAEEKSYRLYEMTYDEIKRYDVGSKPHPVYADQQKMAVHKPLLADLIDSVEAYAKAKKRPLPRYNIETKMMPQGDGVMHPEPEEFVKILMAVIREKGIDQRVTIQSFDPRSLEIVHRDYPKLKTALLVYNQNEVAEGLKMLTFKPTIYSPHYKLVDEQTVKACHDKGIQIIPWTVNEEADIARLKQWGVDGIISDFPNLL